MIIGPLWAERNRATSADEFSVRYEANSSKLSEESIQRWVTSYALFFDKHIFDDVGRKNLMFEQFANLRA